MVLLNQDQLLGTLIPDVYISKIILESSGETEKSREDNPHIDIDKKPIKIKNLLTGIKKFQRLSLDLSNKKDTSDKLIVTVELVLKEKFDNGLIGTWFKNEDFKKYIRLKIIQSTKPVLTEMSAQDKNVLLFASDSDFFTMKKSIKEETTNKLLLRFNSINREELKSNMSSGIESKILNVKDDIEGDKTSLTQHYTEVDENGNTITTFVFRAKFELKTRSPEHLTYFAFSYLDLKQISLDYGFKLNSRVFREPIGKIASDIVFESSSLVGESFVYVDESGAIWVGAIDEVNNGEFFGISKDGSRLPLRRVMVGNSKIQDFRNFDELEKINLDFSIIENELARAKIDNPRRDSLDIKMIDSLFSDFHLARDDVGNSRFFFSTNYRKMLETNAAYGKLFVNDATAKAAMEDSYIVSMKLLRRRVKGSPEAGSAADVTQLFDENQIDETVGLSGEKSFKTFVTKNDNSFSLREIPQLFVSGIDKVQDLSGVRHFTGVDKVMPSITDGYYVYGVEMEVKDSSYDFIQNRIVELKNAKLVLERYYNEGIKLESTQTIASNNNPHIDFPGETKVDQKSLIAGNFNPFLNRFTQRFINDQIKKYGLEDAAATPWGFAVRTYVNMLKLFSNDIENIPFNKLEKSLFYFTHPATGNPSGIAKLIKLMETLEAGLSSTIGGSSASGAIPAKFATKSISALGMKSDSSTRSIDISRKNKSTTKTFKIVKFFNNFFDSNVSKSVGYDFLNVEEHKDTFSGLKVLTGDEYGIRVEREINHFFIQENQIRPDINIKLKDQQYTKNDNIDSTSYSFLTPARIRFGTQHNIVRLVNSPTPLADKTQLALFEVNAKSYNTFVGASRKQSVDSKKSTSDKNFHSVANASYELLARANVEPIISINRKLVPLSNLILEKSIPRVPSTVDPIVEDNSVCDRSDKEGNNKADNNTNPTPIMIGLIQRLEAKNLNQKGLSKKGLSFSSNRRTTSGELQSIKMFDLASNDCLINKVVQGKKLHSAESFFQGESHNTTLTEAMAKLPNQIKSLYLARTSPQIVRRNAFKLNTDPMKDPAEKAEFRLNYQMINTVQVFNGYKVSVDGDFLLKYPIWIPLTLFLYNQSTNGALLCRLKPYENKVVGIVRDSSLELPHYDEYFILTPKVDAAGIQLPIAEKQPALNVVPTTLLARTSNITDAASRVGINSEINFAIAAGGTRLSDSAIRQSQQLGNINSIGNQIGNTRQLSTNPVVFDMTSENRMQHAVRTEYMSSAVVSNNTKGSNTSKGESGASFGTGAPRGGLFR